MGCLSTEVRTEVLCGYICELEEERNQLRSKNTELLDLIEMMLLVCKSRGIVGGIFMRPNRNSNLEEYVYFEKRARELGAKVN